MFTFLLILQLLLAVALIGVVLVQRSEGGALGIGGGGLMSGRGSANFLTRATAALAAGFIVTSLWLAILSGGASQPTSILEEPERPAPAAPSVPLSQ
jgi:preprotein translocase subunit SecG